MAEAVVSIGIQTLWDILSQEYWQIHGVEDKVTELNCELELLSSLLKDAEVKKHTSAVVRKVIEQIKEIIYDGEDTIETFVLNEKIGRTSGIKNRIRRLTCIIPERRKIALEIGGISKRISTVSCAMEKHGIQKTIVDRGYIVQPLKQRQKELRQEFSRDHESDFVGLEENVKTLVGYLVDKDDIQIVSVKVVLNLTSKERKDEILKITEAELHDELFQLLETSKSLVVFDDLWKEEDWDLLKPIFPPKKGWMVLLTSRCDYAGMHGDIRYVNFKPECLTIQDSWTLFQRIVMSRKDASKCKVDEEMEEIGKQMIKHCGGLPLAVKALGGLLSAKFTLHDWKRLSENIGSQILTGRSSSNNKSIKHVLSMSFEELPCYLKHCFLYLAHFPEDYEIELAKLSYIWVAEGISKAQHYEEATVRDIGDTYVEELVRRNMVISERDVKTLRFETCHLHDMMREVCLSKAKEENFLHIVGTSASTTDSQSCGTPRRFVLHNPKALDVGRDISNSKVRSLVVVVKQLHWLLPQYWMVESFSFRRLQLLRVLDLYKAQFEGEKLPSSIGKLRHLRYLNLRSVEVYDLPNSLQNLKLLIYLNLKLRVDVSPVFVPNVLMGMQNLRYLALPKRMEKETRLELRTLLKFETLINFSTMNGSVEDLHGMNRLRKLSVHICDSTSRETLSSSIGGMIHLENLKIRGYSKTSHEGIVLDFIHLKKLKLDIELPRQQQFPSGITVLSLSSCGLVEDPMPVLEKLLQLKEVKFDHCFSGKRMVCSGSGFPQLQELSLRGLDEWEEWIVEEGSMPLLHTLTLYRCDCLKELPDGLRYISSLKNLSSYLYQTGFNEKLSREGQDYYKIEHIPHVRLR